MEDHHFQIKEVMIFRGQFKISSDLTDCLGSSGGGGEIRVVRRRGGQFVRKNHELCIENTKLPSDGEGVRGLSEVNLAFKMMVFCIKDDEICI